MLLHPASLMPLSELKQWEQRSAALANGQPWEESHFYCHDGEGRSATAEEAEQNVLSGLWQRCKSCSSPHQAIYHGAEPTPKE